MTLTETDKKLSAACLAATLILQAGGETYRAEQTAESMCRGFGFLQADVLALPTGISLTATDENAAIHTRIGRVKTRSTDLTVVDECNSISRRVYNGELSAEESYKALTDIQNRKNVKLLVRMIAGTLTCGFFTLMLDGNWVDFGISCFCGLLCQCLLPLFSNIHIPGMISALLISSLSSLIALCSGMFLPISSIEPIISGAIMPVLPGLAITNAIRDMIRGDMVSGGARMTDAILTALMIAAGVGIVLLLWGGAV